jgi:CRISPR/Cas system CMR subunit Cmr6 (Cas7 group RAMP superfamily)
VVAEAPREKRQFVQFSKHLELEKDFTKVYLTLISVKGGSIKIKHEYIKKEKNKEEKVEAPIVDNSDLEAVLKNLDEWYKVEVVKLPSYINMMKRQLNFKELNKTERLLQCYPGNLAYENQQKIF